MGIEIERKFLLANDDWRDLASGIVYRQGYLSTHPHATVRVRTQGNRGVLTVKGKSIGLTRLEYEYEIPLNDANALLDELCGHPLIEKKRYKINHKGFIWEIDEFSGENKGLILAEIELESEEQTFTKPSWVGKEVSGDPRYYNSNLARAPFTSW